jgi:hypothetical protein
MRFSIIIFLLMLFSVRGWAGYADERPAVLKHCRDSYGDKKNWDMSHKPYPAPSKAFLEKIGNNTTLIRYQFLCQLNTGLSRSWQEDFREAKTKTIAEKNKLRKEFEIAREKMMQHYWHTNQMSMKLSVFQFKLPPPMPESLAKEVAPPSKRITSLPEQSELPVAPQE